MLGELRRRRLLEAMAKAKIEALVVYGNAWQSDYLRYATDFGILEGHGIAVVYDGGIELFLDSAVDADRAEAELAGDAVKVRFAGHLPEEVGKLLGRFGNQGLAAAPKRLLPNGLADKVPGLEDGTKVLDHLLMHKLPEELKLIREAARLADEGYAVFREAARAGRPQYELVADVEAFLRKQGAVDNFMILGSGGRDVFGMVPPSDRRLAPGDLVTTELTPAVRGYYAQICRTLVVGRASDAQKRAHAIYLEALEAGIAAVKPGTTAAAVAKAENDVFRKYGLGDYVTNRYTRVRGHGIGLFVDTKPHILEDVETVLDPGMAFIIHPNTYHPDVGYIVLGDAVIVTDTGVEVLCRTPRELFEEAG